jgi:hypothetical protein
MMDRIMKPNMELANPMGAKSFKGASFSAGAFRGAGAYQGVKTAPTKTFGTRSFLGIRNPWFGKKVYQTSAARELTRYVLSDKSFASRTVETMTASEEGRASRQTGRAVETRSFLARGKSQAALDAMNPAAQSALSIDQVRDVLNRDR